jgi:surface carbohydrate biosynthesis protein
MIEPGRKVVLFPIEIVVRELDFRLLLGAYCARADTQIVLGRQHLLQKLSFRLHGALFVGKGLAFWKSDEDYRHYKTRGFRTIFLHEEGGIYEGGDKQWAKAVHEILDVDKIEAEDHVCPWGEFQAQCYRERHPRCAQHIVVTGHPRFNLCSPTYRPFYETEVNDLKRRYGKFILINTNFSWNNAKGMDFNFRWYHVKPGDSERRTFYVDQFCISAVKWARFVQLINHLSNRFPEFQVVVRPHPAENIRYYTELLQHIPRVTVTRQGGVQAWLLACEAVIHDGCTTAIEAYQAGARVINFRPVADERFDIVLPNLVGVSCATEAEVEQALRRLLNGESSETTVTSENVARIKALIDNFGAQEDAFPKLARIIHQVLDEIGPTRVTGVLPVLGRQRLKDALWRLIQPLDPVAWQRRLGKRDRGYQKFPPLKRTELETKIRRIREITGRPVFIRFHSSQLFSMFLESEC